MSRIPIDSLVRGLIGQTQRVGTMRVYRVSSFGWVAGIGDDGLQRIMYDPEVIEGPRPITARRDIPSRLS